MPGVWLNPLLRNTWDICSDIHRRPEVISSIKSLLRLDSSFISKSLSVCLVELIVSTQKLRRVGFLLTCLLWQTCHASPPPCHLNPGFVDTREDAICNSTSDAIDREVIFFVFLQFRYSWWGDTTFNIQYLAYWRMNGGARYSVLCYLKFLVLYIVDLDCLTYTVKTVKIQYVLNISLCLAKDNAICVSFNLVF